MGTVSIEELLEELPVLSLTGQRRGRRRVVVDERAPEALQIAAQAQLASAEARAELVRAQIDTAGARVLVADAAAERVRQALAHTQIRAPRADRITKASVAPGGDCVQVGQEVLALGPERERPDVRLSKAAR